MGAYSDVFMSHFASPRNVGEIAQADRIGMVGIPGQGPFFLLFLRLNGECVAEARYQTHGCGPTIAAGSMMTEMIRGRSIEECLALTVDELIDALGGVPPHKVRSPAMAIAALQNALRDFRKEERASGV